LKIKEALIQVSIVILSEPGYAKADKSQENEAKTRRGKKRVNMEILCTVFFNNLYHLTTLKTKEVS